MATVIIFNASESGSGGETGRKGQIRVDEALEEVVAKLGNTTSGFVDFSLDRDPTQKVWVNRDQVQMVRGK
jgi:hypothetical protein